MRQVGWCMGDDDLPVVVYECEACGAATAGAVAATLHEQWHGARGDDVDRALADAGAVQLEGPG